MIPVSSIVVRVIELFLIVKSMFAADITVMRKTKLFVIWVDNLMKTFINQGVISIYGKNIFYEKLTYDKMELFP